MENATHPKTFTDLVLHITTGGITKVSDKLVLAVKPMRDKSKAMVVYYNNKSEVVSLDKVKMLPAPLKPGQKLIGNYDGVIYQVISANAKNKTYNVKIVFVPSTCQREHVKTGGGCNIGFSCVGRNYFTIESLTIKK